MRGLKMRAILALGLGALAIAGCGERDFLKPPKMVYGHDICVQCRMIIEDGRFACAAVLAGKDFLKFDDIGCLATYEKKLNGLEFWPWVRDASADKWIKREQAYFVHSRDLVTPMGYGFAAFAHQRDAMTFAQEKAGRLITWEELLNLMEGEINFKMEEMK